MYVREPFTLLQNGRPSVFLALYGYKGSILPRIE
jgi:hypothetical protein